MTPTAPCQRCGAWNPDSAGLCAACGAALDTSQAGPSRDSPQASPTAARWRRHAGAAAIASSACAIGAFAIYEIHRTMPAVPPGFERGERAAGTAPPPTAGDEARFQHLRRPEPGLPAVQEPAAHAADPPAARQPVSGPVFRQPEPAQRFGLPAPAQELSQSPPATGRPTAASGPVAARAEERLGAVQKAQCDSATALARVVCNERVRLRYCRDRWNAHPDCRVQAPADPVQ